MNKVHSLRSYRGLIGSRDRPEYGRSWIRIPLKAKIFIFSAINSEHNEPKTFLNGKVINDWNYESFSVRLCPHHTATNTQKQPGTGIDRSNTSHLTLLTLRSKLNSHLLPLFIYHRSSGEKLIKYQSDTSCVIMSVILMTTLFYKALILQWEIWCWSLLGFKGLSRSSWPWGFGVLDRNLQPEYLLPSQWIPVLAPT